MTLAYQALNLSRLPHQRVDLFARFDIVFGKTGWSQPRMKFSHIAAFAIWTVLAAPVSAQDLDA